jgi:hypothetical protein
MFEKVVFMEKKRNVVKYRKPKNLNIGVVIFGIIFLYIVFDIFSYITKDRISVYEVQQGTIAENNNYEGFIVRTEKIFNSDYNGFVDYYKSDATKTSCGDLVYSVDENGDIANKMNQTDSQKVDLSSNDYSSLKDRISDFAGSYHPVDYYNVYSFKEDISAKLMEKLNQNSLESLNQYVQNAQNNQTFHLLNASKDGVVAYYVDGYEGTTVDSFTPDMLNALNYNKKNLKQNSSIKSGDAIYKLITSEDWQIVIQVSNDLYQKLAKGKVIKIKFKKDDITCYANYEFKQIDNQYYMVLSLKNHMIRFANDRYIEIELMVDEESGLKIPNSAITKKEFFTVPKDYFLKGGDSNSYGLMVTSSDKTDETKAGFVQTDLFYEKDNKYYIDEGAIEKGTIIQKPDSNETFTISETAPLDGVYNINKGYAIFKQIDVLFQNEEYSVVRTGTDYGIALYDHIALEGNKVKEDDLIQ